MEQINKLKLLVLILCMFSFNSFGQKWKHGVSDTYDGKVYYSMVENSKTLSRDTAFLAIRKIKGGVNIAVFGPKKKGNWCEAGFRFDGDEEKYVFGVTSLIQDSFEWNIKHSEDPPHQDYDHLINKLKNHSYVIVRLTCSKGDNLTKTSLSMQKDLKFSLKGSSTSINYVLNGD